MYISHSWLKKYLPDIDRLNPDTISHALTESLAEVERHFFIREKLEKIVCGEVLEAKPLKNSNHLKQCLVDTGETKQTIICGAANVAAGQKVAVCMPGGKVYNATSKNPDDVMTIKAKSLNGVKSHGMICSEKELKLGDDHNGILILEPETKVGADLIPTLKDIVYEIENKSLSHRPDCFGHLGIAKELSAILNIEFINNQPEPILAFNKRLDLELDVKVDEKLCPRFTAAILSDIEVKQSPLWLLSKLTAVDVRPVNNIADITNYIMLDVGQPLHAYDYDKLAGKKLVVRNAKEGEKFSALNGKQYDLIKENLVVCDGDGKGQDLAGIMGGSDSEITGATRTVVLEAANWNMYNIRRTSRQLGIRSEAGTRFEKGQDPNLTITGLKSALGLILDFTNSEIASDLIDHYPFVREGKTVLFNILSVKRFLGFDLSRQEIIDIFKRLKLDVVEKEKNQEELEIAIPTYRGDLNIEADLLEEVARLYGYSKIQPALPSRDLSAPKINSFSIFSRRIVDTLIKLGCDEISTYSFIDPVYYSELGLPLKECLTLSNPLSPELSVIRNTLVPSLITVAKNNAKKYSSFNLFEINRAIQTGTDANGIHLQPMHLAILCYNKKSDNLYTTIKGLIESLSAELNYVFMYDRNNIKAQLLSPIIHSNRSAVILTSKEQIGLIAEIKPSVLHIAGLEGRVSFIEINLEKLQPYYKPNKTYRKVSVFPSVYRDLSFWLNNTVSYQELVNTITALNINTLKAINLQDEFINPEKANTKSLTIRIELQDTLKTLTESDITPIIKKIVSSITNNLKATLRDSQAN